ncbi:TetR/AcrR family transcriptional regulator [Williamsia maris]|uniref:Transcriptional regulator, TetR family n=1 Tax=Williamsia maris TaxID=72806 RepID=A0ABT1HDZ2_9NOCA|nr:TetR/AcrR family transcriptional regulator [Williamsia maris]MCP2175200.1 transcriptional regulator, TetR family [Williamsia maris]
MAPPTDPDTAPGDDTVVRLLEAMATSVDERGFKATTVADVVRIARTSRRTFYEHFSGRDDCFLALLARVNGELIAHITAAVDRSLPWREQVRQAIEAWISGSLSRPAITLSWILDTPGLGTAARAQQRESMAEFYSLIADLLDSPTYHVEHPQPVSRYVSIILVGGLRELLAIHVEDSGDVSDIEDIVDAATEATIAVLSASID